MSDLASFLGHLEDDIINLENTKLSKAEESNNLYGSQNKCDQNINYRIFNLNSLSLLNSDISNTQFSMAIPGINSTNNIWSLNSNNHPMKSSFETGLMGSEICDIVPLTAFSWEKSVQVCKQPNLSFSRFNYGFKDESPFYQHTISRVFLAECSDIQKLSRIIKLCIDPTNITSTKQITIMDKNMLMIGWFDIRMIFPSFNILMQQTSREGLLDLKFQCIQDELTFKQVINIHNFRFLKDCYDTIYFSMITYEESLNLKNQSFLEDLFIQLTKFGSIYSMELVDQIGTTSIKCRFFDIRVPFKLLKMKYMKVGNKKVFMFSNLVNLYENCLNRETQTESQKLSLFPSTLIRGYQNLPEISKEEWEKHLQLKYRRLALHYFDTYKIPLENKIEMGKIFSGEETRLTLMIRNIPCRVTHSELKEYIDITSWGDYDFLCI